DLLCNENPIWSYTGVPELDRQILGKIFAAVINTVVHSPVKLYSRIKMSNKYLQLINVGTNYATRMNRLSRRIFGEVIRTTNSKSMKVVQLFSENPLYRRPEMVEYYPRHVETGKLMMKLRDYGLFRDEHQDFKEEMRRLRALRGKEKTRKGSGKKSDTKDK
ncbi:28S ribosomal protein S33, partial [Blattella germanica]